MDQHRTPLQTPRGREDRLQGCSPLTRTEVLPCKVSGYLMLQDVKHHPLHERPEASAEAHGIKSYRVWTGR